MGYIAHRTIVVIGHDTLGVVDAHKKAVEMFKGKLVSELIQSTVNCYESFFIAPDGSKEYWKDSDEYDEIRDEFIKWLRKQNKDFNFNVDFVVVRFGGDEPSECKIEKYNFEEIEI